MISSVAEQYQIHPQTLRLYEREGLIKPSRSDGKLGSIELGRGIGMAPVRAFSPDRRLYTDEDLELLEVVLHLTRDLGVNLAGVEIVLNMRAKMSKMQRQIEEFATTLNQEMARRTRAAKREESRQSSIPVARIR